LFNKIEENFLTFLDMPDGVQELYYNFWTAMTRRSCVGNIQKCFNNLRILEKIELTMIGIDTSDQFWRYFDRTDTGACVAFQTLPYGMDFFHNDFDSLRWSSGPVFMNCKELNYFACENEGGADKYINEQELLVSYHIV